MDPLLEFCEENLFAGSQLVVEDTFVKENCEVMTYSCMSECTLCREKSFAYFEGERIVGDTPAELVEKVKSAIKEWQEDFGL